MKWIRQAHHKTIRFIFVVLVIGASVLCSPAKGGAEANEMRLVEGNNKFALALYEELRAKEGNLFFSPYSISTALAMACAGARGRTEAQMAEALCFPVVSLPNPPTAGRAEPNTGVVWNAKKLHSEFGKIINDLNARGGTGKYELTVANALWGQKGYGFLAEFMDIIKTNYGGGLNEVDFITAAEDARQAINGWVEKQTNNKIKDLLGKGALNSTMRLVLTNAVYFKGNWASQFKKQDTKDSPFTLANGEKVNVSMMSRTEKFGYMEAEDLQGLEMPYVGGELSMIVLLPKGNGGLSNVEKKLAAGGLSQWLAGLAKQKVVVFIPKFKLTDQFALAEVLKSMGMTDAFLPGLADFSGMNGKKDLFISAVIHKAYVDVNEEGTEAAAATGITMAKTSAPARMPVFQADHPFLFLIRDNHTGSILFIGRVMNPKG